MMGKLERRDLLVCVFVLLAGAAPAVLGETVVYDNSDPCGLYYAPGDNGFTMIADDMNLAGTERELVRYSFDVNSPLLTAPYNVTSELYTGKIDPGTGYPIPDTQIAGTYCAHVVNSDGYLTVNCTPSGATLPDRVWMVLSFDASVAGWVTSGAAEVGETGDYLGLHDGVSWGTYWFGGPPDPWAGFEADIWCQAGCESGDYVNPGMNYWTCPDANFVFGGGGGGGCVPPIPADFFGPGSDPFEGQVACNGEDPVSDATTERNTQGHVPPPYPSSDTVELELKELALVSVEPITVTYDGGMHPELWDVEVDLSAISPPPGMLNATKTHCNGGTYTAEVYVQPRFTFTKVDDPGMVWVLDTGLQGLETVDLNSVGPCPWEHSPDGNDFRPAAECPMKLADDAGCSMTLIPAPKMTDSFWVQVDTLGEAVGGGSGYNGGNWYYYPNTNWWNEWFYDHPFDPDRMKVIDVNFTILPLVPGPSWATVAYNWSTPDWPDPCNPPLPPLDPCDEDLYIERSIFFESDLLLWPQIVQDHFEIPDYNPEWISIDVNGFNFEIIDGWFDHACLPKDLSTCWDPLECAGQPSGDATCDGVVNLDDLAALKAAWGMGTPWTPPYCCADFTQDGQVNLDDLAVLKACWGGSGHIPSTGSQNCKDDKVCKEFQKRGRS
jgi:hypothetical protein